MRPTVARLTIVVALPMLTVPLATKARQAGINPIVYREPVAMMEGTIPTDPLTRAASGTCRAKEGFPECLFSVVR